jgi:hypothetical protein
VDGDGDGAARGAPAGETRSSNFDQPDCVLQLSHLHRLSISSSSLGALVSSFWMLRRPASLLGGVLRLAAGHAEAGFPCTRCMVLELCCSMQPPWWRSRLPSASSRLCHFQEVVLSLGASRPSSLDWDSGSMDAAAQALCSANCACTVLCELCYCSN